LRRGQNLLNVGDALGGLEQFGHDLEAGRVARALSKSAHSLAEFESIETPYVYSHILISAHTSICN
jgi:hypothetical protein